IHNLSGGAQTTGRVVSGFAYYQKVSPGNIRKEEGLAITQNDTTRLLFIEVSGKTAPTADSIFYKYKSYYKIVIIPVKKLPAKIGKKEFPAKGNSMWQLLFSDENSNEIKIPPVQNRIIVKGYCGTKPFRLIITKERELPSLFAQ
ncbi:MAG: hypothetical protein ABL876_12265, partial [Chitinophagaceae bacterium]